MTTAKETTWDHIPKPVLTSYWTCYSCGRPSSEYTDHDLCFSCATGDHDMTDVTIQFYSDTNLAAAYDEMELLQLDTLRKEATALVVDLDEFRDMEEPIKSITDAWGGLYVQ